MSIEQGETDISIRDLLVRLRKQWRWIAACVAAAFILGVVYLNVATYKYTVTLNVTPVQDQAPSLSNQFGDIASLIGINLPFDSEDSLFQLYRTAVRSQVAARAVMENPELLRRLFEEEWSDADEQWKEPVGLKSVLRSVASTVLGEQTFAWTPPSLGRVTEFLQSEVRITEDRDSPMLSISMDHADPELASEILLTMHNAADEMLRERILDRTSVYIDYLTRKLDSTIVAEYRQALADTLSSQEKLRMFASADTRFVADVFDQVVVSERPTVPNPLFVVAFSVVFGLFVGVALAVFRPASPGEQASSDAPSTAAGRPDER